MTKEPTMSQAPAIATDPSDSEPSRWDMIREEIQLDTPAPELPQWAALAIAAISAILPIPADVALAALEALVAPLRTQPNGPAKDAVREALAAKQAEIKAARTAPAPVTAPMPAPAPHTVRQAIPTVQSEAPAAPVGQPLPLQGQWRKYNDEWHVLLIAPEGATLARVPRVGDIVATETKRGRRECKRVAHVVRENATEALVAVEPTDATVPTLFARDAQVTRAPRLPISTPVETSAPAVNSELATFDAALASELAGMQAESAHNAQSQASGSMAQGSMMSVGFTTAQGYVTALANGVKAATAESYKSTLRSAHGYTQEQIDALTVTIIPETALPVGAGITHTPIGPSIFDRPRSERTFRVGSQPSTQAGRQTMREAHTAIRDTLKQTGLIAGLMTERALLQWGWTGGGERKREAYVTAFEAANISTDLVPPAPSAERSAGHAVEALKGRDYDTKRLPGTDLPEGVKARWQVGRALTGDEVTAGASYGTILLVVNLHDDGSLTFDGDAGLASIVRGRYNAITGGEILKSDVLTAWLGKLLKQRFYAVKDGSAWYIPAGERDAALHLYETIRGVGWGSHRAIRVTDERDVASVLSDGLKAEISRVGGLVTKAISEAQERARAKATKDKLDPELAARRATLTTTTAATLIKAVATVSAHVAGYATAMGEDSVRDLRRDVIAIQRALETVAGDETTARFAMLETE